MTLAREKRRIRVETASIYRPKCPKVPPAEFQQPAAVLGEARDGISHYVGDCSETPCIPASSTQSERDFSSTGHTVTDMQTENTVEALELLRW